MGDDFDSHDDGMIVLRMGYRDLGEKGRLWSVMNGVCLGRP